MKRSLFLSYCILRDDFFPDLIILLCNRHAHFDKPFVQKKKRRIDASFFKQILPWCEVQLLHIQAQIVQEPFGEILRKEIDLIYYLPVVLALHFLS